MNNSFPSQPTNKRFGLTGASGFIGRHLVRHLQDLGHKVTPLSRKTPFVADLPCVLVRDFKDVLKVSEALKNCDVVVHLAALAHGKYETESDLSANVEMTETVARATLLAGAKRLVLISSIGVNGDRTQGRPFRSDDSPSPTAPYAISKWQAEERARIVLRGSSVELVVIRPPLVYGSDCEGSFSSLMKLVRRMPVVPLGSLKRLRSFIHVDNLCEAIAIASLHPVVANKTYVLADGVDITVAATAKALAYGYGKNPASVVCFPVILLKAAAFLTGKAAVIEKISAELIVDASEFMRDTGWTPKLNPHEAMAQAARMQLLAELDRKPD